MSICGRARMTWVKIFLSPVKYDLSKKLSTQAPTRGDFFGGKASCLPVASARSCSNKKEKPSFSGVGGHFFGCWLDFNRRSIVNRMDFVTTVEKVFVSKKVVRPHQGDWEEKLDSSGQDLRRNSEIDFGPKFLGKKTSFNQRDFASTEV